MFSPLGLQELELIVHQRSGWAVEGCDLFRRFLRFRMRFATIGNLEIECCSNHQARTDRVVATMLWPTMQM